MNPEDEQIGFAKFSGELVDDGFMDARKSAQALLGFDAAVRFYLCKQDPSLKAEDFELPVKVEKGSWMIVVGVIATAYGVKAAQKMAENDFKDVGMKDVLKKSLEGIQSMIRLGKHLGDLSIKKFDDVKFLNDNQLVGVKNPEGKYLYVSKEHLDFYVDSSPSLLKQLSELVEDERQLTIGVIDGETIREETITLKHRRIFTQELFEEEPQVLPELIHGQEVTLEAEVTRANEMSNTIGIRYGGHIITGFPNEGSIVRYKSSLFLNCKVNGHVLREGDGIRPKIIVNKIEPFEKDNSNLDLLDGI